MLSVFWRLEARLVSELAFVIFILFCFTYNGAFFGIWMIYFHISFFDAGLTRILVIGSYSVQVDFQVTIVRFLALRMIHLKIECTAILRYVRYQRG